MKILLLGILVMSSWTGFSQNNKLSKNDPEAKAILDKVSSKFKTYKTVQANFSLSVADANGKELGTKKGVVYIKVGS